MTYYKVLTHDYCPPVQGGSPIWDGESLPFELPKVSLDISSHQCGAGWNYVTDLAVGFKIAGLWSTGRPSQILVVEPGGKHVTRGDKSRAESLRIRRRATKAEIREGVEALSEHFGEHAGRMVQSQLAWRDGLARPQHDPDQIETSLIVALESRGLDWELRRFDTTRDAWDARGAWDARDAWDARVVRDALDARDAWVVRDARDARDAWDARVVRDALDARDARDAWDTRDAWDARVVRVVRDAWDAWDARDARVVRVVRDAWDARDARDAWDARAALTVEYAALKGWTDNRPDLLTRGIRTAYRHGLDLAIPTGPNELGYSVSEAPEREDA